METMVEIINPLNTDIQKVADKNGFTKDDGLAPETVDSTANNSQAGNPAQGNAAQGDALGGTYRFKGLYKSASESDINNEKNIVNKIKSNVSKLPSIPVQKDKNITKKTIKEQPKLKDIKVKKEIIHKEKDRKILIKSHKFKDVPD